MQAIKIDPPSTVPETTKIPEAKVPMGRGEGAEPAGMPVIQFHSNEDEVAEGPVREQFPIEGDTIRVRSHMLSLAVLVQELRKFLVIIHYLSASTRTVLY